MRKLLTIILFIILCFNANAQFNFMYRQYALNQLGLNPAYTGSREVFVVAAQSRLQWVGIEGAPRTYTVSADAPLKESSIALGFYAIHEQIGNTSNYNFDVNYAFRRSLSFGKLSLGLKTSANVFSVDQPLTNLPDEVFMEDARTYILPNFGAGLYFYDYNKFFFGLSVPSFLSYEGGGNSGYKITHNIRNYNFLGSAGVLFNFGDNFKMRLSSLTGYNIVTSLIFDVNSMFIIKDLVWIGGSYHSAGITTFMAQWRVNPQLKI